MNNKEISSLLKPFLKSESIFSDTVINQATTNLQLANTDSICFYHITDADNAKRLFLERLESTTCRNLIVSKKVEVENANVWVIDNSDFLKAQEIVANLIYPNNHTMKIAGITGTNGKTTVSYLAMQMATLLDEPAISIGTIGVRSLDKSLENDILSTTPSYLELRKIIHRFQDEYKYIFMEVSSHALAQNRLHKVELEYAAWTSFSQDHLDYHKDYDDYFNAKLKILESSISKDLIIPSTEPDLKKELLKAGVSLDLVEPVYNDEIDVGFKASYNQANLGIAKRLVEKVTSKSVDESILKKLSLPAGRFESISFDDHIVIVDYAHTPDALENICGTIKKDFSEYELRVVFGCGGDRDKLKRPLMGSAVSRFADSIIVTSDNPRSEVPEQIIDDILPGITVDFKRDEDRRAAIHLSLSDLKRKTVILIAGKGHEEYQDIKGKKHHFSDREVVLKYIDGKKNV